MATIPDPNAENITIYGKRIGFIGTLKGAALEQIQSLVQEQGGVCVAFPETEADLVVLGEEEPSLFSYETFSHSNSHAKKNELEDLPEELFSGEFVSEANFLNALTHCEEEVQSLYTPGMLAELLRVSVAVIKRWYRRGYLVPRQVIKKVPYFLFEEVQVARHLVSLRDAGCTLAVIDQKMDELSRLYPESQRSLLDPSVVVDGSSLRVRRGAELSELSGQLLIDFENELEETPSWGEVSRPSILSIREQLEKNKGQETNLTSAEEELEITVEQFRTLSLEWEMQGDLEQALEAYRVVLATRRGSAEDQMAVADLLYRNQDLAAARERYYVAIEMNDQLVEARCGLGCVLSEMGEMDLAISAFQGALSLHAEYADVHYQLANVLDKSEQDEEATEHWKKFLRLAPESPWAEEARDRLGHGTPN